MAKRPAPRKPTLIERYFQPAITAAQQILDDAGIPDVKSSPPFVPRSAKPLSRLSPCRFRRGCLHTSNHFASTRAGRPGIRGR